MRREHVQRIEVIEDLGTGRASAQNLTAAHRHGGCLALSDRPFRTKLSAAAAALIEIKYIFDVGRPKVAKKVKKEAERK